MAVVLVVLSFVVLVGLDYFVFSRRTAKGGVPEPARLPPGPLSAALQPLPPGTYLQPTGTWSRLGEGGEVYLGVQPMLLGLVGSPHEIELLEPGTHVARGETLARIGRAGRQLSLRSPVSGRVERVYDQPADQFGWRRAREREGEWLYRLLPDRLAEEAGTWLSGEVAATWARRRYDDVRDYLQAAALDRHLGPMMADGGELPAGVLGALDQSVWSGLERRFLDPTATEARP